jgi:hypothetical protein
MAGIKVIRKFRRLYDVTFGTPNDGDVVTYDQATDKLVMSPAAGGGAPTTADYLVGTAQGGLSAEIVVGAIPGGELGGTWGSPTVDTVHSGSSHAATQAAAEATAAAALSAHINDVLAAHAAAAISVDPTNLQGVGVDAQTVLEELDDLIEAILAVLSTGFALTDLTDVTGQPPNTGEAPVWDGDSFELTDIATQADLDGYLPLTVQTDVDVSVSSDGSVRFLLDSGTDDNIFSVSVDSDELIELQSGDLKSELGAITGDTSLRGGLIRVGDASSEIGFFNQTPAAQQAAPTTANEIVALLQAYGLSS